MEINSPDEFIEQPVIDIEVEFSSGRNAAWTINDQPDLWPPPVSVSELEIRFNFLDAAVTIERQNVEWFSVRKRIDRLPVKKEGARPGATSRQPEGGTAGNVD